MNPNRLRLWSPLPPAECRARLEAAIDHESFAFSTLGPTGLKPVLGRIDGSKFRLRKRIDYRNSFQSSLAAEMLPEGTGTAIVGSCGLPPFVQAFMGCWIAGVVLIGGAIFLGSLGKLLAGSFPRSGNEWVGLVLPPVMLAFGVGLLFFGRRLARDETRFLTDFLVRTLDAEDRAKPSKIDLAS